MLRCLKMRGKSQSIIDVTEQGAAAFEMAVAALRQWLHVESAKRKGNW